MTLIALDLDGTLEDSRVDMVGAVVRLRHRLGLTEREGEGFTTHVNRGMDHLYRFCFSEHLDVVGEAGLEDLRLQYEAEYGAHIAENTALYPGIRAAVIELATLGKLALVTNKPEALSRLLLSELGLTAFFSAVVGGDTAAAPKPSPVMLEEACSQTGRKNPVVMIGDSAGDIRCGQSFGATTVWCAWGYHAELKDITPDQVAQSPGELVGVVRRVLACC